MARRKTGSVARLVWAWGVVWLFLKAPPVWAVQIHEAPEGLYVHQMGHFLFLAAMAFFLFRLHRNPLHEGVGWSRIKTACVLFLLWNVYTFIAHWLETLMPPQPFVGEGSAWGRGLAEVPTALGIGFYLFKFDHLLCAPAIVFFFLGIKSMAEEKR